MEADGADRFDLVRDGGFDHAGCVAGRSRSSAGWRRSSVNRRSSSPDRIWISPQVPSLVECDLSSPAGMLVSVKSCVRWYGADVCGEGLCRRRRDDRHAARDGAAAAPLPSGSR